MLITSLIVCGTILQMSESELAIDMQSIDLDRQTMSLDVIYDNKVVHSWNPLPPGDVNLCLTIDMPCTVSLIFGNKTPDSTHVDEQGHILRNLSVILEDLRLDGISAWPHWLDHGLRMIPTDGGESFNPSRTICHNGKINLVFDQSNAFFWLAKSKLN